MSPRIIQMPLSGGDRKHYARELRRIETLHADLVRRTNAAYLTAHRLGCEEWNARQFIGGPAEPSPMIGHAIDAGCGLLEVTCRRCGHTERVRLLDLVWPRDKMITSLVRVLFCRPCEATSGRKYRPDLVALLATAPDPAAPLAQAQRKTR
jgi:hypothetical protein